MIFNLSSLLRAYYSCRKGKRNSNHALYCELDYEDTLHILSTALREKSYEIGTSSCFVISYPTIREIFAAYFNDRIIHHLLIMYIQDEIDKKFIFDSLACRKNKGGLLGVQRTSSFLNKITHNNTSKAYYLKMDIRSFFYSIDKDILAQILLKDLSKLPMPTKDIDDLTWLSMKIIYHNPCQDFELQGDKTLLQLLPKGKSLFTIPKKKGLAIGNLTSQFFANLYLNEVDQFIKRQLKIKYYLRYADDMLLISNNIKELQKAEKLTENFLLEKLKLNTKKEKTTYGSVYQGIDFVGYVIRPEYILSRNRTVGNLKKKLHYFNNGFLINRRFCIEEAVQIKLPPSKEDLESICTSINSTFGHLRWSNSYRLRKNIYEKHFGILKSYLEPQDSYKFFRPIVPTP
jgi:RNA-directed DNA polymerase